MSQRYLGGIITANPTAPTLTSASGVWTTEQQFQNIANWPKSTGLVSRSVRLRSSATAYLNRTPTATSNQQVLTISCWVKRGKLGASQNLFQAFTSASTYSYLYFTSGDVLNFANVVSSVGKGDISTNAVFRDLAAWYHVVLALNYAIPSATIYVNGVVQSVTVNTALVASNLSWNTASIGNYIGSNATPANTFDGYMTEINFIDGQALTPSYFGFTDGNGVWQPATYSGTYGTNGFYLNFSDNSGVTATTIGKDYSGNGNNWTPNNISVTAGVTYDSMLDVPTLYADGSTGRGNYATLNPLDKTPASTTITASNGNLQVTSTNAGTVAECMASTIAIPANSGKWYWECQFTTENDAVGTPNTGIIDATLQITADCYLGSSAAPASIGFSCDGQIRTPTGNTSYTNPTSSQVVGFAYDSSNGKLWVAVAGTWQNSGDPAAGTGQVATASWYANGAKVANSSNRSLVTVFNFGQRPFTYTPPTGFVALNTQNLPTPTISNGATVMAATTYTGTGSALTIANTVGSASFQPDLVWVKGRSGATDHAWYDAVRGVQLQLESNNTAAETTETTGLTAFGSTGFTVGALAQMNTSAATYVAWQWNAGGSTVTNTSGSISAQVRANATAGFSVVTFTGTGSAATVGHGLGVAPQMIIAKTRNGVNDWFVYTQARGATKTLYLNLTNAEGTTSAVWNNTSPTSTVFTVGTTFSTNTCVAYCFAAVAGYSAFGSYTGNGSTDGPFVFLGFRPRFVLFKRTDAANDWVIHDSSRNTFNVVDDFLKPNLSNAEGAYSTSGHGVDFLSSGMKLRTDSGQLNASTGTYIYAAFAENPFKLSRAR